MSSNNRWHQLKTILEEVLEHDEHQRAGLLTEACGDDTELRAELESLLRYHEAGNKLSDAAGALTFNSAETLFLAAGALTEIAGRQFGHYQLIKELGQGGMGTVYLATRADDYRQQVALKLIKRGLDDAFVLERFRNERQILAALNHPNIARLFDGGTSADGLPYLVMEYIVGLPIDEYCRQGQLSLKERLQLFRQVCSAVQFAHQHLVIHRDLKPSNILVTSDGVPKLLDFGIAKLLTPELASQTLNQTAPGIRLMTPAYASPEQVRGEPITTASDVYALGVILYELLTGRSPYQPTSGQLHEMMRAVCEEQPERPSTAITRAATASAVTSPTAEPPASQPRTLSPEKLRRSLRGDLDNIVLMALRKEPGRRYASVEQFSEDIRRHLEGLPVSARKDTFGYRTTKFVKRNKLAFGAATLLLLTLIAGIVTTQRARARAEQRFNDVRKLAHAVVFDYHDAIANLPGSTPVRERLVKDALEYLDSLAREAGGDGQLQRELASAYEKIGSVQGNSNNSNLGDTDGAMKSYRKSLAMRERLALAEPANREVQAELASGQEDLGDMLYTVNDLRGSLRSYEQALAIRNSLLASDSKNVDYRYALAELDKKTGDIKGMDGYLNLGDTAGAVESYRQALKLYEELFAAAPQQLKYGASLANCLANFGHLSDVIGDLKTAVEQGRRAVSLLEQAVVADPNDIAHRTDLLSAYNTLRQSLVDDGQMPEAVEYDRKTVQTLDGMSATDPKNALLRRNLSVSYNSLGRDLRATGDTASAIAAHRKALSISEALAAADPKSAEHQQDLANTWQFLADAQASAHDPHAALENYRKAVALNEALLAAEPDNVRHRDDLAIDEGGVGTVLAAMGDLNGALAAARRAVTFAAAAATQSPANLRIKGRLALRHFECGQLYARLAQAKSSGEQKANWQAAREQYQRSFSLWNELKGQGKLARKDAGKPDEVARELAKCEAALAKLSDR
ncbi:MAG: protein kinase [Acidobacteria bacterium]|nr:protein kinase [Acidobacteriota bacterium]MBI3426318.1 protein kinase [Acidobacteriota bacterium]